MKKIIATIAVVLCFCVLFVGCGDKNDTPNEKENTQKTEEEIKSIRIYLSTNNAGQQVVSGKEYYIKYNAYPIKNDINISYSIVLGNEYASISGGKIKIFNNAKDGAYIKIVGQYKDIKTNEIAVEIVNYTEQIGKKEDQIQDLQNENSSLQSQLRQLEIQLNNAQTTYEKYIKRYCSNGRDWDEGTPASVKAQAMRYSDQISIIGRECLEVERKIRENNSQIQKLKKDIESLREMNK